MTAFELPPAATGLRRVLNYALLVSMHVLPGPLRRRLGWWRWDEVLDGSTYGDRLHVSAYQDKPLTYPVSLLRRRGIGLSHKVSPWPQGFTTFHNTWNWDNKWTTVPIEELSAWAAMWRDHPQGQECLYGALVGNAQRGDLQSVATLLAAGAKPAPLSKPTTDRSLMRQLWGASMPIESRLAIWKLLVDTTNAPSWQSWVEGDPVVKRYNAKELAQWKQSGVSMPTGAAALLLALEWVKDPPVSPSHDEGAWRAIEAVRWWKTHGNLPPDANTQLLKTWLSSARPGSEPHYQKSVAGWGHELLSNGLPPRPLVGPRWSHMSHVSDDGPQPWSHWVMTCPFFENLPPALLDRLCSEPDAWTACNQDGNTFHDLLATRIEDISYRSREAGLPRIKAWADKHRLEQVVEQCVHPAIAAPRPRL